jgi:hypothetical protein
VHFFGTLNDTLNSTLNVSNHFRTIFKYFNDVPFNVPFKVGFWGTSAELFNLSIYSRFTLRIDRAEEPIPLKAKQAQTVRSKIHKRVAI